MSQLASGSALSLHSNMYKGLTRLLVSPLHRDSERWREATMTDVLELESHSCIHRPLIRHTWEPPHAGHCTRRVDIKVDMSLFLAASCLVRGSQILSPGLLNHDLFSHFKFFLVFFFSNFYYVVKPQTYRDDERIQWIPMYSSCGCTKS